MSVANNKSRQSVLIVDDHPLFIVGLKHYLGELEQDIEVVEATSIAAAWASIERNPDFDYVFLDIKLPDQDGISFLEELKHRKITIPVLVISASEEPAWVHNAIAAGAVGYLSKTAPHLELTEAFAAIHTRGYYISSNLRKALHDYRAGLSIPYSGHVKLTRRQQSVLKLIADGLNNREICTSLNISESTVKGHISILFDILDVHNRTSCIREAKRFGLL
jgi:DNA-binding NarL/FixJ family response regulator